MPIAELFLGAFLKVLSDRLASRELLNFAQRKGIDVLLKKWEEMLVNINLVLDDAEDKQLNDDHEVNLWLKNLRKLAYDIEDLLEEFTIESVENKSKADADTSKVRSLLPSCCFRLSLREFMFNRKMRSNMVEMDSRLKDIITQKNILSLRENIRKGAAYRGVNKSHHTTCLPEPCFVSREVEKMEILELLTDEKKDDRTRADLKVIPIVGMGGIGKTALVQQVYNDARVTDYFDVKAWTCVSDDFDVLAITNNILEKTNGHLSCEGKDLDWLHDKLKEHLARKKFLVVLDDVWNENYEKWTILLRPFQSGAKGSKIIVTTRNFHVAKIAFAQPYTLKPLSQDACMTLFTFYALGATNFDDHPDLEELGLKIVEKCQGLPLAVTTLARLLSFKVNPHEWKAILNSKIWDLPKEGNDIISAFELSYLRLPLNMRTCFTYCAIFPSGYEIERDELIRWWIVEGLLEGEEGKNRWNVGLNFFNELVSRSLLQESSSSESRFLMHDLVSDLAKLAAGTTFFSSRVFDFEGDQNSAFLARHASFIPSEHIVPERFKIYHGMKGLRSFISLVKQPKYYDKSYLSKKVLYDLLSKLKFLRVLSLCHYRIREIPDCIGKLRYLRSLNLSYTNIETLPKSIATLYYLEALMLRGCQNLTELPEGMEKLINLKFLDFTDTPSLKAMPLYIGNLVGLEMLSKFIVGTKARSRLNVLKNLENLGGELHIFDLHKVQEVGDATDANLYMKEGICQLTMQWCKDFGNFRNEELEANVLNFLCPHPKLENLAISYYGGLEFPSWLGSPSYVNMVHLRLHGCCRAKALASLGQLSSLKELYIKGLNAIRTIGSEFYGTKKPFLSLITLEFKDMPLWDYWSHPISIEEVGDLFHCLEHLVIQDCPMLIETLPSQLSSLKKLDINSCMCMDASSSIISLPSLNELNFGGCNEGILKSLVNLTSLTTLVIRDVVELTCLNFGFTSSLVKLEKLEINSCKNLMYLWQERDVIRNLACLKSLVVKSCPEFISFSVGEGDIELSSKLETMDSENCINLEKYPSEIYALSSLQDLTIEKCPKFVSFPEIGMLASLISLNIRDCKMLQSLPRGLSVQMDEPSSSSNNDSNMTSCLQELKIWKCDSLLASPFSESRYLSTTLKTLEIRWCVGVESLAEIPVDHLQSLQRIDIIYCKNLRSLPQGLHTLSHLTTLCLWGCSALELECFPPLPPGISTFWLWNCPKIKSLPNQLHRLTSLQSLKIMGCENITRFPDGGLPPQLQELKVSGCENITRFPDGGLPPQLQELKVSGCKNMKQPVREWLTPLISLQRLCIDGSAGGVEEEEDLLLPLPSSLLHLEICNMWKVERLSSSLPPSLRILEIQNCPKLRELPQDGLPSSLEHLRITGCRIMKERCREGTGKYWPLINEIPKVTLGNYYSKSIT